MAAPQGPTAEEDGPALDDTLWAGVVLMIALLVGYAGPSVLGTSIIPATATTGFQISGTTIEELAVLSMTSAVLVAIELALCHRAFRRLRDPEFRTPGTLAIIGVIGILLLALVDLGLLESLNQLGSCLGGTAASTNSTAALNCVEAGPFVVEALGLFAFAILVLIGLIGTAIGIYRLGRRHDDTVLKVAAVLLCLPLLNFVGAILLIAGSHGARARLGGPGIGPYRGLP